MEPRNTNQPRSLENLLVDEPESSRLRKNKKKTTVILISVAVAVGISVISVVTYFVWVHFHPPESTEGTSQPTAATSVTKPTTTPLIPVSSCSSVSDPQKFDCYPDLSPSKEQCEDRGCCYDAVSSEEGTNATLNYHPLGTPQCYYPPDYKGYKVTSITKTQSGYLLDLERTVPSGFPNDIKDLKVHVVYVDGSAVRITIRDTNDVRHEVPLRESVRETPVQDAERKYEVGLSLEGILSIKRKATGTTIFNTDFGKMVYSDQFLQLSSRLPSKYIYGLGEHYDRLLKNVNWTRTVLFNRDNFPLPNKNLYGTHPLYIALENDHNANGVFLLNSHAMDVILQPAPAITYRLIGGIFDFFVFLGPSADEVVQQYTGIMGRPFMPPYWSFGFHLCKFGYNSLNETRNVWNRTRSAGIPFDTQWNDIDYMDRRNDFTFDEINYSGLPEFVEQLHDEGMHYVVILDPGISSTEKPGSYPPYDDGVEADIFIKNQNGSIYLGKVWNYEGTVFPDFMNPATVGYWAKQFENLHKLIPFDGAWIDMNEPANYPEIENKSLPICPEDSPLENPVYVPGGVEPLRSHTVCMSAQHFNATPHYSVHNMYGYYEAMLTHHALTNITNKRPFIISRSTFSGQGFWSGHWSGDIKSSWEDMRYSVIDLLNFNIFGIPMMGSDICGFRNDTTDELCARWSALGSFYPFSRNHNDIKRRDQDPAYMGGVVLEAARNTLITRYRLLPYLYYLFYQSHVFGNTVTRPLFFEFTDDPETYDIDEQFMWGSALMIMPALHEGATEVEVYFPKAIWYDYYTGERMEGQGTFSKLPAPNDTINLALRGGYIIPHQYNNLTTTASRLNKFYLLAGIDEMNTATGELYWDDGESLDIISKEAYNLIKFYIKNNTLQSTVSKFGYDSDVPMVLDYVKICGLTSAPSVVKVNDTTVPHEFDKYNCLGVTIDAALKEQFAMEWKFQQTAPAF